MAVDPEKAIEKLSEYRKESQVKKDTAQSKKHDLDPISKLIRSFFIRYYWFNAGYMMMLTFISFFGMIFNVGLPLIFWLMLFIFNILLMRQFFRTIDRLNRSDGRKTTIDDAFITIMAAVAFVEFLPLSILETNAFITVHVTLTIIWLLQIFFVNFRKPDLEYVEKKTEDQILEEASKTTKEMLIEYFNASRSITMLLGLIAAVVIFFTQVDYN